jgi:hypothetical protein
MALRISPPPNGDDVQGISWKQWFFKLRNDLLQALDLSNVSGILSPLNGGTGTSIIPTNGQVLIGNGSVFVPATLTPGVGISVSNGAGSIIISATGGGASGANKIYETSMIMNGDYLTIRDGDILTIWDGYSAT